MKKVLAFICIIAMFILVGCIDVDSTTSKTNIADAKAQAEINRASRK